MQLVQGVQLCEWQECRAFCRVHWEQILFGLSNGWFDWWSVHMRTTA